MSNDEAATKPDATGTPIIKGDPQDWFRIPVDVWEGQKNIKWSKKAPAPEAWAIIDAAWLDHHEQLPRRHRRSSVRQLAARWGWTYAKTCTFLCDFHFALYLRDRQERVFRIYRSIRSKVVP